MRDESHTTLARLRRGLEATDDELLSLVARRARQVRAVWAWKRHLGIPLHDAAREEELLRRWVERASRVGLDPEAITLLVRELLAVTSPLSTAGGFLRAGRKKPVESTETTGHEAATEPHPSDSLRRAT